MKLFGQDRGNVGLDYDNAVKTKNVWVPLTKKVWVYWSSLIVLLALFSGLQFPNRLHHSYKFKDFENLPINAVYFSSFANQLVTHLPKCLVWFSVV